MKLPELLLHITITLLYRYCIDTFQVGDISICNVYEMAKLPKAFFEDFDCYFFLLFQVCD